MLNKKKLEIQPSYADCYVLASRNGESVIYKVLESLFQPMSEKWIHDQFLETEDRLFNNFENYRDLLRYLDSNLDIEFFSLLQGAPKDNYDFLFEEGITKNIVNGIKENRSFLLEIQYTVDGGLILGISCATFGDDHSTMIEDHYFTELKKIVQSEIGYIGYEESRPDTVQAFINKVKSISLQPL